MRGVVVMLALSLGACSGPPASDAALCRDVIHRLCLSRCTDADAKLKLTSNIDCTATLTNRTGCGDESFKFVDRSAFLSCRLPIIRANDDVEATPDCNDVDDMFRGCPTLVNFYNGVAP